MELYWFCIANINEIMISLLKNAVVNNNLKTPLLKSLSSFSTNPLFSAPFCNWVCHRPTLFSKSNWILPSSLFPSQFNPLETSLRHYHKHKWNHGKPSSFPPSWSNKRLPWHVRKEAPLNSNLDSDITPQNQQFLKVHFNSCYNITYTVST